MSTVRVWVAGFGLLAVAAPALGQQARLTVSAGRIVDPAGMASAGVSAAPSLSWWDGASDLTVGGHAAVFPETGAGSAGVWGSSRARLAGGGPVGLHLAVQGAASAVSGGYRSAGAAVSPRLRVGAVDWSVEAGPVMTWGGAGSPLRGDPPAWRGLLGGDARETGGVRWRAARGITAEAGLARGSLAGGAGWRTMESDATRWTEWTGSLSLAGAMGEVSLGVGLRSGGVEERWMTTSVAVPVHGRAAVVAEAGRAPSDPLTGRAPSRYASIGITLH